MSTISETALIELRRFFFELSIDQSVKIIIAFSGGADSLAAAILLSNLFPPERLHAVYVNHRLRSSAELDREEQLNRRNCESLGIPLSIIRLERKQVENLAKERGNGIEEAARKLRYEVLETKRRELQFDLIVTAHTANDQSETVLMRLLQGAGPAGLQGIAKRKGVVIRPLLDLTRDDIERIVADSGLSHAEDSTNTDERYLRNSIRHALVPTIARLFPQYNEALSQVATRNRLLVEAMTPQVEQMIDLSILQQERDVIISLSALSGCDRFVLEQVVYHGWNLLSNRDGKRFPYRNVQLICDKIVSGWADGEHVMASGTMIMRRGDVLLWQTTVMPLAEGYVSFVYSECTELDGEKQLVLGGEPAGSVPVEKRARIDESTVTAPIIARSCRDGDAIRLTEGTKRVVSLFSDWHIAPQDRWRIPVLEDAEGIFAVLGGAYGGRDRVAARCLCAPLARNGATLYSVTDIEG